MPMRLFAPVTIMTLPLTRLCYVSHGIRKRRGYTHWSPRSPAMVRTPGWPSKVGGSARGSESSLLRPVDLTLGTAVGIVATGGLIFCKREEPAAMQGLQY